MEAQPLPIIAVTMGDPAGIGPELVVKSLAEPTVRATCRPVVIGDVDTLRRAVTLVGSAVTVRPIRGIADATFTSDAIEVISVAGTEVGELKVGAVNPEYGRVATIWLTHAYELAARGELEAVVSAPINKQAFHAAGYNYFDELEYLAEATGRPDALLLGAITPALWTIAVTGHVPFRSIPDMITRARVLRHTRALHQALVAVGVTQPRLAVAALNVHGGEGGLFGREDMDEIAPAIADARAGGIDASGPVPADAVFVLAQRGRFDGVVCMYHDQANLGRKLLVSRRGATVYLGLPVPCTTTTHGTAFDIAWRGVAEPTSLIDCFQYASGLARIGQRS